MSNMYKKVTVGQIADNFDFFNDAEICVDGSPGTTLWTGDIYLIPYWYRDLTIHTDADGEGCYITHKVNEHGVTVYTIHMYVILPMDYTSERIKEFTKAEKKFNKWITYREEEWDPANPESSDIYEKKKQKFLNYCKKHDINGKRLIRELG